MSRQLKPTDSKETCPECSQVLSRLHCGHSGCSKCHTEQHLKRRVACDSCNNICRLLMVSWAELYAKLPAVKSKVIHDWLEQGLATEDTVLTQMLDYFKAVNNWSREDVENRATAHAHQLLFRLATVTSEHILFDSASVVAKAVWDPAAVTNDCDGWTDGFRNAVCEGFGVKSSDAALVTFARFLASCPSWLKDVKRRSEKFHFWSTYYAKHGEHDLYIRGYLKSGPSASGPPKGTYKLNVPAEKVKQDFATRALQAHVDPKEHDRVCGFKSRFIIGDESIENFEKFLGLSPFDNICEQLSTVGDAIVAVSEFMKLHTGKDSPEQSWNRPAKVLKDIPEIAIFIEAMRTVMPESDRKHRFEDNGLFGKQFQQQWPEVLKQSKEAIGEKYSEFK